MDDKSKEGVCLCGCSRYWHDQDRSGVLRCNACDYCREFRSDRRTDVAIVAAAKAWGAANRNRADAFPTSKFLDAQDAERQARDALFALVDPGEG